MSIWIEESPTSRAMCPICGRNIIKGELRVGGNMGSGNYPYNYHFECWLERNKGFVRDLLRVILPRLFGEDAARPLLITLEIRGGEAASLEE